MPSIVANGFTIEYEELGRPDDPALLLVMGLGSQLTLWPDEFCEALAGYGYRVIRYDNRDIGLSSKMEHLGVPNLLQLSMQVRLGLPARAPYTLLNMAEDAKALLEALQIDKAHVVGASMGGMISQILTANFPFRVKSLTSIMSSSGNPRLPLQSFQIIKQLFGRPKSKDRDTLIRYSMDTWKLIGSPGYPTPHEELKARITRNYDRSYYPPGYKRHLAAIIVSGNHVDQLKQINVPTLVLHGEEDPLHLVEYGRDVAKHVPRAQLHTFPGMGHNLPSPLIPELTELIHKHIQKADS